MLEGRKKLACCAKAIRAEATKENRTRVFRKFGSSVRVSPSNHGRRTSYLMVEYRCSRQCVFPKWKIRVAITGRLEPPYVVKYTNSFAAMFQLHHHCHRRQIPFHHTESEPSSSLEKYHARRAHPLAQYPGESTDARRAHPLAQYPG